MELFEHLVNVVIPLVETNKVLKEPPVTMPTLPKINKVGTISELASEKEKETEDELVHFKANAREETNKQEERGEGDWWFEMQHTIAPNINKIKEFKIEMLFDYTSDDGEQCLQWLHGEIEKVLNKTTSSVRIV